MKEVIFVFLVSVLSGLLCARAINRFMDGKIEQWSFEYQVFGFGGMLVCALGMCYSIGAGLALLMDNIYYMFNK